MGEHYETWAPGIRISEDHGAMISRKGEKMDGDFTAEKKKNFSIKDKGGKFINGIKRSFGAITVPGLLKVALLLVILHLVIFLFRPVTVVVKNAPLKARRTFDYRRESPKTPARRPRTTTRLKRETTTRSAPARKRQPQTLRSAKPYRRPVKPVQTVGTETKTVPPAEK